jgi:hypothetical protein
MEILKKSLKKFILDSGRKIEDRLKADHQSLLKEIQSLGKNVQSCIADAQATMKEQTDLINAALGIKSVASKLGPESSKTLDSGDSGITPGAGKR